MHRKERREMTVNREELLAALRRVSASLDGRTFQPILRNALLEAGDAGLRITCTDLGTRTSVSVPGASDRAWAVTAPLKELEKCSKALPKGDTVSLCLGDDGRLVVSSGRREFTLRTLPAEDFPVRVSSEEGANREGEVDCGVLRDTLARVTWGASTDETCTVMCTVCFDDGQAIATDSRVLCGMPFAVPCLQGALLPAVAADLMVGRVFAGLKGAVGVGVTLDADGKAPVTARFACGVVTFKARLVDGQFPNWRRIIELATPPACRVTVTRDMLAFAKVAALVDKAGNVKLDVPPGGGVLRLWTEGKDRPACSEEFPLPEPAGEAHAAVGTGILLDVLGHAGEGSAWELPELGLGERNLFRLTREDGWWCIGCVRLRDDPAFQEAKERLTSPPLDFDGEEERPANGRPVL